MAKRMRLLLSRRTTPRFSSALSVALTDPSSTVSSATRMPPSARASSTARCLAAVFAGTNCAAASVGNTQRSSTGPTPGWTSFHSPSTRLILGAPPGGVNRCSALVSGQRYSREIHLMSSTADASKYGVESTPARGLIFAGSPPSAMMSSSESSWRPTT